MSQDTLVSAVESWSTNPRIREFVIETVKLCQPDAIHFCDGSEQENQLILKTLTDAGTLVKLNEKLRPNSYLARGTPSDVSRVEERTFICTNTAEEAGPLNNWMSPADAKGKLHPLLQGCMRGRTLYVCPFAMGPVGSPFAMYGIELSDSAYVVANMKIMTRIGTPVLQAIGDGDFVPCFHSVGVPLAPGQQDATWPCNPDNRYICHFPHERFASLADPTLPVRGAIVSFGSGYGGNALLGKKCLALRIGSYAAREEGWLAEHMLIMELTSPQGQVHHICAALPSACGKTNLAMLWPTRIPGADGEWRVRCVGDDIAWLRKGADGRLWAINPEAGFFGVAPGTGFRTNRAAMETMTSNAIFTNVALTSEGDVWWEGMTDKAEPEECMSWLRRSWQGNGQLSKHKADASPVEPEEGKDDEHTKDRLSKPNTNASAPHSGRTVFAPVDRKTQGPAAHPNSRFTVPASQCPIIAPSWEDPQGVPISAIIFGGRRDDTIPCLYQTLDFNHGAYTGLTLSSQTTAAAVGKTGVLRNDPMAMRPFIGYDVAAYAQHWVDVGAQIEEKARPLIFGWNVFRKNASGAFEWPGFSDNVRLLEWIVARCNENQKPGSGGPRAAATECALGLLPAPGALDLRGLSVDESVLLRLDKAELEREADRHEEIMKSFGKAPEFMVENLAKFRERIAKM